MMFGIGKKKSKPCGNAEWLRNRIDRSQEPIRLIGYQLLSALAIELTAAQLLLEETGVFQEIDGLIIGYPETAVEGPVYFVHIPISSDQVPVDVLIDREQKDGLISSSEYGLSVTSRVRANYLWRDGLYLEVWAGREWI